MDGPGPDELGDALLQARLSHTLLEVAPWQASVRDAPDAYRVQERVHAALSAGLPTAWKSGGPSRTATLTHASLPGGVWGSPADASSHPMHLCLVEAEIALRLGQSVSAEQAAQATHEQALGWIDRMAVAIELVDSRWADGADVPPLLKLADFQAHGALVTGAFVPFAQRDWAVQGCEVRIGNAMAVVRHGSHSLGDPTWLLPTWLRHATRGGNAVPAGTIVTTGTWCGMLPARRGEHVTVRFPGIGEAEVQL
jgi:hypothetical protein